MDDIDRTRRAERAMIEHGRLHGRRPMGGGLHVSSGEPMGGGVGKPSRPFMDDTLFEAVRESAARPTGTGMAPTGVPRYRRTRGLANIIRDYTLSQDVAAWIDRYKGEA